MAKERRSGKSGKVYIDVAGGTTYTAITLAINITLPPQNKGSVDMTAMEDTSAVGEPGIEELAEFAFEVLWDPEDAVDLSLRTAYEADTLCGFMAEIVGSAKTHTRAWQGYLTGLVPNSFGGSDPVTLQVTGIVAGTGIAADAVV